jgi:hypothetical protein
MQKLVKKTNGKKTTAVSIISVLFEALTIYKPELLDENSKGAIRLVINSGLLTTLAHKAWRNRKEITEWAKSLFPKNK